MGRRSASPSLQRSDILSLAVWFGLLTGFIEVALRLGVQRGLLDIWLYYGPHYVWMAPLAEAVLFGVAGLAVWAAAHRWPRLASLRTAIVIFASLAFFTLSLMVPGLHPLAAGVLGLGFAVQSARVLVSRAPRFPAFVRRTTPWLAAAVAVLAIAATARSALAERRALAALPEPEPGAPNVLLLVLDTVRASSLSVYGYPKPTTPELARFAEGGVSFERALSTAPWTPPSHYSMMTGRFPHELLPRDWHGVLDETYPTLAEVFSAHGYRTAGFVANYEYTSRETGLGRGFAHYEDYPVSPAELALSSSLAQAIVNNGTLRRLTGWYDILGRKTAARINADLLEWLAEERARPFFAFLNYYDAHEPYLPPPPFDTRFGSPSPRENAKIWHFKRRAKRTEKKQMTPEEVEAELAAYEGAVGWLDHELGRLFEELRARGLAENTIVVVTSDHGEQFGEHGKFEHSNSLYRQVIHVPLLIVFPGRTPPGTRVADPVSLRDMPATILGLAGLRDQGGLGGRSLARFWEATGSSEAFAADTLLSEFAGVSARPSINARKKPVALVVARIRQALGLGAEEEEETTDFRSMKSLVDGGYHYIRNGDGGEELYDFEDDPAERTNLTSSVEGERWTTRFAAWLDGILRPDGAERTARSAR